MKTKIIFLKFSVIFFLTVSCDHASVSKKNMPFVKTPKHAKLKESRIVLNKRFENGLNIYWYQRGKGALLKQGDLVDITYEVKLSNGEIVDGNKLVRKKSLPFLVGFNLQTPGWDLAFKELKVGDSVKIVIPGKLARGVKGIKGLIPPNADNFLFLNILSRRKPNKIVDSTFVWLLEENRDNKLTFNDKSSIFFHAIASTPSLPEFVNTFRLGKPFGFCFQDKGLVPGLRKALTNAKKFDRLFILVPPSQAYGERGYLDLVKPNEPVLYNVLVMDVVKMRTK